ncbi:MAG: DUF3606 domain-containing protein [Chitinophagaceae bacterium]
MNNEFSAKKPADLTKINVGDTGELLWWSYQLNTTPENLLSLVQRFGAVVSDVKKNMKEKHS